MPSKRRRKNAKTHIPRSKFLTYCGKHVADVECIDLKTTSIEDATCINCQRSDNRRVRETHERETAKEEAETG